MSSPAIDRDAARDGSGNAWLRALAATAPIAAQPYRTLAHVLDEVARDHGDGIALISEHETLSYAALVSRINRYARWALEQGIEKGDVVCLLMPNRAEYLAVWLGISRVGGTVALLNTHLVGVSLAHCIDVVAPKHVIVDGSLVEAFEGACPALKSAPAVWSHGGGRLGPAPFARIDEAVDRLSGDPLTDAEQRAVSIADRALYIYTSGTTGLPKAALVSHERVLRWSLWFAGMMGTSAVDRMYDCLPLYHSVGGVVATGALLVRGGSVVIRERFSASGFWDDVTRSQCTLFQYIGELCRYLLNAPYEPGGHKIRLCCGNGLRPEVWTAFKDRFRIPQILEFYAATEANISLYNAEGEPGAVGRIPPFLRNRLSTALIKTDPATGEPVRGADGFGLRCAADEPGELIGQINGAHGRFEGYSDGTATDRKILRDVFVVGDRWFRSGDLMRRDTRGFFYFLDRMGDTFRWKGENVATSEVEAALTSYPGIIEANVYGVSVPGADGRAGMAAITVRRDFDLDGLHGHLASILPDYAQPLFLRLQRAITVTPTFKYKKTDLVEAGFDPARTDDEIYFNDGARGAFVRVTEDLLAELKPAKMRL
jgi:fatty-acyl-CoA synthase